MMDVIMRFRTFLQKNLFLSQKLFENMRDESDKVGGDEAVPTIFFGGDVSGKAVHENRKFGGVERFDSLDHEPAKHSRENIAGSGGSHSGIAGDINE